MRKKSIRITLGTTLTCLLVFLLYDFIFPFRIEIEYSGNIYYEDGRLMHAFLSSDEKWRMKAELDEVPTEFTEFLLFKEDKYYYYHPGVNPIALVRAALQNILSSSRVSGASTITMQLARLLDPAQRTYFNKCREILRALQLELHHSKAEILQAYFNLLPYGGNIEGIKTASYLYLQKPPASLSPSECLSLSIIPNTPNSLRPGKHNSSIEMRRDLWAGRLLDQGEISHELFEELSSSSFEAVRTSPTREAHQLARFLRSEYPAMANIRSSVAKSFQQNLEKLARAYIKRGSLHGYNNASAVLVNNHSKQVLAYLGSNDFDDKENQGENDGVQMVRSPGSTLKPLLFALALDKGLISPSTMLLDVPRSFSVYEPENYEEYYSGQVSASEALQRSLNVPFVSLLDQVGIDDFNGLLERMEFETISQQKSKLGLSTILGGCGVSMLELCKAYACLASGGKYSELKFLKDEGVSTDSVFSPEAAYLTSLVLRGLKRPGIPEAWIFTEDQQAISWKTGTSYGRRDAWTIAYNEDYTLCVWIGNFSGEGVSGMSGYETAAPLAFEIFNTLHFAKLPSTPEGVLRRMVCQRGGLPPSSLCSMLKEEFFIPGTSPNAECNHLEVITTSIDGSLSYCSRCAPDHAITQDTIANLSPILLSFLEQNQLVYERAPPHNPTCPGASDDQKPDIYSPNENTEYLLDTDQPEIPLRAGASKEIAELHWFANDVYLKSSKPNETVFAVLEEGSTKISCVDERGRKSEVLVRVKKLGS